MAPPWEKQALTSNYTAKFHMRQKQNTTAAAGGGAALSQTNLMSSPLRKRMRSPGFSPHSSAGVSARRKKKQRWQKVIKHQSKAEDGSRHSQSELRRWKEQRDSVWPMWRRRSTRASTAHQHRDGLRGKSDYVRRQCCQNKPCWNLFPPPPHLST